MPNTYATSNITAPEVYGNIPVWEDLNFGLVGAGGPAATVPDYVIINDVIHREFTSANNQFIGDAKEIPHHAQFPSILYQHVHFFLKSGESEGTTGVEWTIYHEIRTTQGTISGSCVLSATSAELAANAHEIIKSDATGIDLSGITGGDNVGPQLSLRIARTGGDAGDVIPTTFGVHFAVDSLGSQEIWSKRV